VGAALRTTSCRTYRPKSSHRRYSIRCFGARYHVGFRAAQGRSIRFLGLGWTFRYFLNAVALARSSAQPVGLTEHDFDALLMGALPLSRLLARSLPPHTHPLPSSLPLAMLVPCVCMCVCVIRGTPPVRWLRPLLDAAAAIGRVGCGASGRDWRNVCRVRTRSAPMREAARPARHASRAGRALLRKAVWNVGS
jgi:hypothetical protein